MGIVQEIKTALKSAQSALFPTVVWKSHRILSRKYTARIEVNTPTQKDFITLFLQHPVSEHTSIIKLTASDAKSIADLLIEASKFQTDDVEQMGARK